MSAKQILVVGAGMVGASAALALADLGYEITVIESVEPQPFDLQAPPRLRVSALSPASIALLQQVDAWPAVAGHRLARYTQLSVAEADGHRCQFGQLAADADALGVIVENDLVQWALWQRLLEHPGVSLRCGHAVQALQSASDGVEVGLTSGESLCADLLLVADGAASATRSLAGIGVNGWHYRQHCLVATVALTSTGAAETWQVFYPSGPRAYLPLYDRFASLVWYDRPERIKQLSAMDSAQLAREFRQHFPAQLPPFELLEWGSFPLRRQHANRYVDGRVVLAGDAAHVISPLAGQGVNIGFADVAELVAQLGQAQPLAEALATYQRRRQCRNWAMMTTMDVIYKGFTTDSAPLKWLRNAVLAGVEQTGPLKRLIEDIAAGRL